MAYDFAPREPCPPLEPCPCCRQKEYCFPHPSGRHTWSCGNCGYERFSGVTWPTHGSAVVGFYFEQVGRALSLWALVQYGHAVPAELNWGYYRAITEDMLDKQQFVCCATGMVLTKIPR